MSNVVVSKNNRRLEGVVFSTNMEKTIVVVVERSYRHPIFGKIVKKNKKYKVHDERGDASVNDVVEVEECAPISKTKHMRLVRVMKKF